MWPKAIFQRGALLFVGVLSACGSSSAGGNPAGVVPDAGGSGTAGDAASGSCSGSAVSWKDDGALVCASSWVASGLHGGTPGNPDDTVEIVALNGLSIGLSLSAASPPPLDGTYGCSPSPAGVAEITYRDTMVNATTDVSCALTVSLVQAADGGPDGGAVHAVGTFSAVLSVPDAGTTKNLTDGVFDVPVQY